MDVRYDSILARSVQVVCALQLVALGYSPACAQTPCSPRLFAQDTVFLIEGPGPANYCLTEDIDLSDYIVRVDGLEVSPVEDSRCAVDTSGFAPTRPVNFYSTSQLPGNGFNGPFKLETWDVDGTTYTDSIYENVRALAEGMAMLDPAGGWYYNEDELGIAADTSNFRYSQLFLTQQVGLQPTFTIDLESLEVPDTSRSSVGALTAVELIGEGWIEIEVTARDSGCSETLAVFRDFPRPLTRDTLLLRARGDNANGPICVDFSEFESTPTGGALCGPPQNGSITISSVGCVEYTPNNGYRGPDTACLVVCADGGTRCDTTDLFFTVGEPADCPEIFAPRRQNSILDSCATPQRVCLPSLPRDPAEYTIRIDGTTETDLISCGVAANQVAASLLPGSYFVGVVDDSNGCSDTMRLVVSCETNVPGGECPELTASSRSILQLDDCDDRGSFLVRSSSTDPRALNSTINGERLDGRVVDDQLSWDLDTGEYDIFVADPNRGCGTRFSVSVSCDTCALSGPIPALSVERTVRCGGDSLEVCLPGPPSDFADYQIDVDGEAYTGRLTGCNVEETLFINLTTMPSGGATGPYFVDSFRINGELFSGEVVDRNDMADTLSGWDAGATWVWDDAANQLVGGNLGDTYGELAVTQVSSGSTARLGVQRRSRPTGTTLSLAGDALTRQLAFDNGRGCTQTVELFLECSTNSSFEDSVDEGGSVQRCLSLDSLGQIATMENACVENDAAVSFEFDTSTGCVIAAGERVGSTTACIVTCDVDGRCDTTNYTVNVLRRGGSGGLSAVNDTLRTICGEFVSQSVTVNDVFDGGLEAVRVVELPRNGTAFADSSGVLTYTPSASFCGGVDSLIYEILQNGDISRATVLINVSAELLEVYTGFSPNGDGENDQFVIAGIENFPTAVVRVYNRWGNLVLEEEGYDNDWEGFWDGKRLPDGTYYYLIELPNEDPLSGFVQIWR